MLFSYTLRFMVQLYLLQYIINKGELSETINQYWINDISHMCISMHLCIFIIYWIYSIGQINDICFFCCVIYVRKPNSAFNFFCYIFLFHTHLHFCHIFLYKINMFFFFFSINVGLIRHDMCDWKNRVYMSVKWCRYSPLRLQQYF